MSEQKIAPVLSDDEISRMGETIRDAQYNEFCSWGQGYRRDSEGQFTIPLLPHILPRFARAIEQAVLARVGAVREWQPINTAPKDGTDILLYRDADMHEGKPVPARRTVGSWLHEQGGTTEYRDLDGHYVGQNDRDGFDGWISWDGGFIEGKPPTHWMPMPGPPSAIRALKGTPAAAVADAQPIDWPAVEKAIAEYIDDYEMVGEDAAGREGYYTPTDGERALIKDAVHGLLAEDELMRHLRTAPQPSSNPGPLAAVQQVVRIACQIPGSSEPETSRLYRDLHAAIAASKEGASHG